ncbi:glycosyltransferase family 1 protein [Deminuibacter soli]|uniref:Glycosyltransferase family 1 protein n=2 Tax=Deminuibacter soli TaxID=2291815 RepID=A0A3E1NRR2_9BACT|nr:glycosyltransferase family 1 protein [Deminuibacter soli]
MEVSTVPVSATTDEHIAIKGKDIVIIGLQPWYYDIGSNCKNIAMQFAQHNRVLYVNLPINRKTYYSKKKDAGIRKHFNIIKNGGSKIKLIKRNMWEFYPTSIVESLNWLPSTTAFKTLNYINNKRFANDIKYAVNYLHFENIILFNDNDIFNGLFLKELLTPSLYVYYCRDFLQGYDYWRKHCRKLEPELIRKADTIVANSTFYSDYCATINPNSYYIGQGCNTAIFNHLDNHELPEDMRSIGRPVIGYIGSIDSARLDARIIETIAKYNPGWNVVLVGPEDDQFAQSSVHQLPNVHFLGKKPLQQLPAYVAAFDVCINPQLQNQITQGNYPLKIDEYLAMGKPVVATRTKAMQLFEPYTWLANEPADYPALVERALVQNSETVKEARIAFAKSHSWENSMSELYKAISKHLKN